MPKPDKPKAATAASAATSKPAAPAAAKPRAAPATTAQTARTPPAATPKEPPSTATARLEGTLELVAGAGQVPAPEDVTDSVVYFEPALSAARPKPGRFRVVTHNKQFDPRALVVPVGSTVVFPNQDTILHNIFSVSPVAKFDLGLYGEGKTVEYTFSTPGLVLVNCNVHQVMQTDVLVVDTPFFVHPDRSGRFVIDGVPAGPGRLLVWTPRAQIQSNAVVAPNDKPLALRVALTKARVEKHLNKENREY